jgi:arabinose-5-phosphate isomerase
LKMQCRKANDSELVMKSHKTSALKSGLHTVKIQREGLSQLEAALASKGRDSLGHAFEAAVSAIDSAAGRVIVTGMGKSGHIARKIAATLASTGRPAAFVHPAEASHGDLGMVQDGDVVVGISWSGETAELAAIITYAKRYAIPLIAMTAHRGSTLGREADICLVLPLAEEAGPNGIDAPTTSTTMLLVLGDALAVALLEIKGFTAVDFKKFHPGGKLGAKLNFVRDVMHTGDRIPRVARGAKMDEAIVEMSVKGFGCVGILDEQQRLEGIITDGDLRRHLKAVRLLDAPVEDVMTCSPRTIGPDDLVAEALEIISHKISALFVVDHEGKAIGILHFHDLLRLGAV